MRPRTRTGVAATSFSGRLAVEALVPPQGTTPAVRLRQARGGADLVPAPAGSLLVAVGPDVREAGC
jgi:hypothetical protein